MYVRMHTDKAMMPVNGLSGWVAKDLFIWASRIAVHCEYLFKPAYLL